jgi:hypothetical protein
MRCWIFIAGAFSGLLPLSAESLSFTINWPSGLSLGEATLRSDKSTDPAKSNAWTFDLDLDAGVPGFAVRDRYHSGASADFCSARLEKTTSHGSRKSEERVTFAQDKNQVKRETAGGGKTEFSVPPCARDALTFLQFVRRELAQGRLAPQQSVVFGALYQVRLDYTGVQQIQVGGARVEADRIQTSIKGPASDLTVELFFARDPVRTPVLARLPLPLGAFTVELMR